MKYFARTIVGLIALLCLSPCLIADPFTFTLIGRSGLPFVSINNNGVVAYSTGSNIMVGDGAPSTTLMDTGGWFSHFGPTAINDAGVIAFAASLDGGVSGIFATNGTDLPTAQGLPDINNSGTVPFAIIAPLTTDIYTYNPNSGGLGPRIETTGTAQFNSLADPAINDAGQVAFVGTTGTSWTRDVFIGDGTATTRLTSGQFGSISYPSVNNSGTVAFSGQFLGGGTGIFTAGSGGVATVAQEDSSYHGFGVASINNLGWVAYMGSLYAGGNGIFVWNGTETTRVIGTSDLLFDSTVINAYMYPHSLNDSGQIAMLLTTTNGGSWVVRADPAPIPEPSTLTLLGIGLVGLLALRQRR